MTETIEPMVLDDAEKQQFAQQLVVQARESEIDLVGTGGRVVRAGRHGAHWAEVREPSGFLRWSSGLVVGGFPGGVSARPHDGVVWRTT